MPSITEQVMRDQFDYLADAIAQPLPDIGGRTLVFLGCGTSYYLAQILAAAANLAGRPAIAAPSAEWIQRPTAYLADLTGAMVIGLSRSGMTTETVNAMRMARAGGLGTLGISCAADSDILGAAEHSIYLPTDPREGIVMTVSASLMLLAGLRLLGQSVTAKDLIVGKEVMQAMQDSAGLLKQGQHLVYLGAGPFFGLANEGALKVQEMSLSYAQAFHPLEYRHGPISLIDEASLVTIIYAPDSAPEEALVAKDVQAKGARVIGLGGPGDLTIPIPDRGPVSALIALPALQLMGEMVALRKNLNTETPRHLSKVVMLSEG
ncbi:glucosamine--fructose-6-phosphate aminotransferase (isomerizing) [Yoonia maricola]|uniref:Glucosamine--fructose-6-phosphate aminotransferase (Isomerizing) n=1 Tax=Yoonia maricola TaxID=420999 RepID=A0A2M8WLR6_9RHOB|nr:SIS domain-containing protein [Yoonia maricola]PJI91868.1 glucosamine--fructose-6-phosphate aminotransferase (isomerizing) [Yoonia maricola]